VTDCTSTRNGRCGVSEPPGRRRETQRTPGSAAGCNKPANRIRSQDRTLHRRRCRSAEKTGGTVQNGEVGTGSRGWHLATEATAAMSAREWTLTTRSMEGREGPVRRATLRQQCRWWRAPAGTNPTRVGRKPPTGALEQELWRGAKPTRAGARRMQQCTRRDGDAGGHPGCRRRRHEDRRFGNERSKPRRSSRVTDKDERGAGWPISPLEQHRR